MNTIIAFEGFDMTGKDTLVKYIKANPTPNNIAYEDTCESYKKTSDDYLNGEKSGYLDWLEKVFKEKIESIAKLVEGKDNQTIFVSRFSLSDRVYAQTFGRRDIYIPFHEADYCGIASNFKVKNVVLLWASYEDYLKRCKRLGKGIDGYTRELFNDTQANFGVWNTPGSVIIYLKDEMPQEEVLALIKDTLENDLGGIKI